MFNVYKVYNEHDMMKIKKEILDDKRMGKGMELSNCHWNLSASHNFWNEPTKYINYDELFVWVAEQAVCYELFQFVWFWKGFGHEMEFVALYLA